MISATDVTPGDHRLARRVAAQAGRALIRLRRSLGTQTDPTAIRAEGDRLSHLLICSLLHASRPHDAVLSEEGIEDDPRLRSRRLWVIDPLDGTREFGESGRTDWSVHVALCVGDDVVAGAVALPARRITLSTAAPPALAPAQGRRLRIVVSRTRPPEFVADLGVGMDADVSAMGSAGAKAMSVVCGDADIYVHAGGQYEWDSAAPVAVARAAGLHASRLSGAALKYGSVDPFLPDLLICRPELADRVLTLLGPIVAVATSA